MQDSKNVILIFKVNEEGEADPEYVGHTDKIGNIMDFLFYWIQGQILWALLMVAPTTNLLITISCLNRKMFVIVNICFLQITYVFPSLSLL